MSSQSDIASLAVVNYQALLSGNSAERESLLQACAEWGFFYLDLSRDEQGDEYFKLVQETLAFSKRYFNRPEEDKLRDTSQDFATFNICGYKPMALDNGNMRHKKDGCEGLRISSDLCHGVTSNLNLTIPPGARADWSTLESFTRKSHVIATDLLSSLSDAMHLEGSARFETQHRSDHASTTTSVLQHYPHRNDLSEEVSVGHFTHTDTGSITILFNTEWGLQVHAPDSETWKWIPPHPDYAVVNIGDSLKFMSHLKFKSALHRVVPAADRWLAGPRYATIFFLRADNDAEFVDLEGKTWKAGDWLMRKFGGYRQAHEIQAKNPVSTGRLDFLGLLEDDQLESRSEQLEDGGVAIATSGIRTF